MISLLDPLLILITLVVIAIAKIGKVVGTYAGARLIGGKDHWTALSFGAGLNARGAMEIIIATIGLCLGILSQDMFSIIVVMAISTSLIAPFALRWVLKRVIIGDEEKLRLEKEELESHTMVAGIHRILLPVRVRKDLPDSQNLQTVEAAIIDLLAQGNRANFAHESVRELQKLGEAFGVSTLGMVEKGENPEVVINQISDSHRIDLIVVGTNIRPGSDRLYLGPRVESILRNAECPVIVFNT